MSEPEVPQVSQDNQEVPQMTKEELETLLLNVEAIPPHRVFDREQYNRDLSAGLIELSRANPGVSNKAPYNPSDIKAAHNATDINIQPAAGKKRVTIAITIAYNWPADYLQSCLDAMCRVYGLTSRTIEVINLDTNGAKTDAVPATLANVINPLKNYVGSSTSTSATAIGSIAEFVNASSGVTGESNLGKLGWLGELLLDLWAFAMNPNANIRIIGANDTTMGAMFKAVTYASTDSNFATSPNGTTDIVNMSWGGPAGIDFQSYDGMFSNPRICYLGATGDNRYSTYPATSSNVLAVGGTSLYYDATSTGTSRGPYNSVWVGANGVAAGTGGVGAGAGFAIEYARPAYQNNLAALTNYNNTPMRCTPDVSSVADSATGVLIFFTDGTSSSATKIMTQQLGGTSLASPILCGLFSHLVQKAYNDNLATLTTVLTNGTSTQLQTILYTKYASSGVANMFYDVVDGTLNLPTDSTLGANNSAATFSAGTGYDIASGLGFPLFHGILNAIYPGEPANIGGNGATVIATNNTLAINRKVIFNINL